MKRGIIASALMMALSSTIGPLAAKADTDFSRCVLPETVKATKNLADFPSPIAREMPGLGASDGPIFTDASRQRSLTLRAFSVYSPALRQSCFPENHLFPRN